MIVIDVSRNKLKISLRNRIEAELIIQIFMAEQQTSSSDYYQYQILYQMTILKRCYQSLQHFTNQTGVQQEAEILQNINPQNVAIPAFQQLHSDRISNLVQIQIDQILLVPQTLAQREQRMARKNEITNALKELSQNIKLFKHGMIQSNQENKFNHLAKFNQYHVAIYKDVENFGNQIENQIIQILYSRFSQEQLIQIQVKECLGECLEKLYANQAIGDLKKQISKCYYKAKQRILIITHQLEQEYCSLNSQMISSIDQFDQKITQAQRNDQIQIDFVKNLEKKFEKYKALTQESLKKFERKIKFKIQLQYNSRTYLMKLISDIKQKASKITNRNIKDLEITRKYLNKQLQLKKKIQNDQLQLKKKIQNVKAKFKCFVQNNKSQEEAYFQALYIKKNEFVKKLAELMSKDDVSVLQIQKSTKDKIKNILQQNKEEAIKKDDKKMINQIDEEIVNQIRTFEKNQNVRRIYQKIRILRKMLQKTMGASLQKIIKEYQNQLKQFYRRGSWDLDFLQIRMRQTKKYYSEFSLRVLQIEERLPKEFRDARKYLQYDLNQKQIQAEMADINFIHQQIKKLGSQIVQDVEAKKKKLQLKQDPQTAEQKIIDFDKDEILTKYFFYSVVAILVILIFIKLCYFYTSETTAKKDMNGACNIQYSMLSFLKVYFNQIAGLVTATSLICLVLGIWKRKFNRYVLLTIVLIAFAFYCSIITMYDINLSASLISINTKCVNLLSKQNDLQVSQHYSLIQNTEVQKNINSFLDEGLKTKYSGAENKKVFVICGGAGVGKSYTIKQYIKNNNNSPQIYSLLYDFKGINKDQIQKQISQENKLNKKYKESLLLEIPILDQFVKFELQMESNNQIQQFMRIIQHVTTKAKKKIHIYFDEVNSLINNPKFIQFVQQIKKQVQKNQNLKLIIVSSQHNPLHYSKNDAKILMIKQNEKEQLRNYLEKNFNSRYLPVLVYYAKSFRQLNQIILTCQIQKDKDISIQQILKCLSNYLNSGRNNLIDILKQNKIKPQNFCNQKYSQLSKKRVRDLMNVNILRNQRQLYDYQTELYYQIFCQEESIDNILQASRIQAVKIDDALLASKDGKDQQENKKTQTQIQKEEEQKVIEKQNQDQIVGRIADLKSGIELNNYQ